MKEESKKQTAFDVYLYSKIACIVVLQLPVTNTSFRRCRRHRRCLCRFHSRPYHLVDIAQHWALCSIWNNFFFFVFTSGQTDRRTSGSMDAWTDVCVETFYVYVQSSPFFYFSILFLYLFKLQKDFFLESMDIGLCTQKNDYWKAALWKCQLNIKSET